MRCGIVGGGFGLYGYLPAAVAVGADVATLEKYRATIRRRPELAPYERKVVFVDDPSALFTRSDFLILAQRPGDQEKWVDGLLADGWRGTLLLEKPLARHPTAAASLVSRLEAAGLRFAAGFSLLETPWARQVEQAFLAEPNASVTIDWRFMAHHYRHGLDNWKRNVSEGGGAMRFYAIHLLPLLSRVAKWVPSFCSPYSGRDEDASVRCSLSAGQAQASLFCDSAWDGSPVFEITVKGEKQVLFHGRFTEPFAERRIDSAPAVAGEDSRIFHLGQILRRLTSGGEQPHEDYREHIRLWEGLERLRSVSGESIPE